MAYYEDLQIDQGSDVAIEIHLNDPDGTKKNLTNYTAAAKMKVNYNSGDSDTTVFLAIVANPPEDGVVTLSLTNQQTDALNPRIRYVYDVEIKAPIDSDGSGNLTYSIERVLEGKVKVTPSVTK